MALNKQKIDKEFQKYVTNTITFLLSIQNREGVFVQENPQAPKAYDLQAIYPMAYMYSTKRVGNPFYADETLLKALVKIGDYCAQHTNDDGLMYYYSFGNEGYSLDQRFLIFWIDTLSLIKHKLDKKRLHTWQRAMRRSLIHLEEKLSGYLELPVFNSYSFGTSPNHASLYACALYLGGKYFNNKKWRTIAEQFMDQFVESQSEVGYWAEGHGPVGVYSGVSVTGVARMNCEMKHPKYDQALLRSLDYFKKISFPDTTLVDVTDRRQHYSNEASAWGLIGFSSITQGRSHFYKVLQHKLKFTQRPKGEACARMLEAMVHLKDGPVKKERDWTGVQYLENHSAFIRNKSWQINYSVNPVVVHPSTSFKLEYGKIFSLWHKKVGLLIDGSQDKRKPERNTFYSSTSDSLGILYGGKLYTKSKTPAVHALYANWVECAVVTECISKDQIKVIGKQIQPQNNRKGLRFALIINTHVGDTISVGKHKHLLSEKKMQLRLKKGATFTSHNGTVRFTLACAGILHFPDYPFNPYSKTNESTIEAAQPRLELIPQGKTQEAAVLITIL